MRLAALVTVGGLGVACASSHAVIAPTATVAPSARSVESSRTQEFHPAEEPVTWPPNAATRYELPEAFARLSPRDRERWHACHIFFLRDNPGMDCMGQPHTPGPHSLGFTVTPAQYVATDDAARRAFLIAQGCPDSLVDLADGTHLDLIEQ